MNQIIIDGLKRQAEDHEMDTFAAELLEAYTTDLYKLDIYLQQLCYGTFHLPEDQVVDEIRKRLRYAIYDEARLARYLRP